MKYAVDVTTINDYVLNLQNSVELWFDIFNPALSNFSPEEKLWLDRLNRINGMSCAPLLMAFYEKEKKSELRVVMLRIIEKMNFFAMLCGPFFGNGEYFTFLAIEFKQGKITTDRLIKTMESIISTMSKNHVVNGIKALSKRSGGFYEWTGIRYFMYEYEQFLREKTKTERSKIAWDDLVDPPTDHITIEHIYPQKPKDKSWLDAFGEFTAPQKLILRNSLGNLLPLSRETRIKSNPECSAA